MECLGAGAHDNERQAGREFAAHGQEQKGSCGHVEAEIRDAVQVCTKFGAAVEASGDIAVEHVGDAGGDEEGQEVEGGFACEEGEEKQSQGREEAHTGN